MKTVTKAAIAASAGVALLLGGAGSLAYWNDTKVGSSLTIASGNLAIGTIVDGTGWTLQQNATGIPAAEATGVAYTNQLVVPGDTLTKTVSVPITLTGENMRAQLAVTGAKGASNGLSDSITATVVSVNGVTSPANLTPTIVTAATGAVDVVYKVTIPWNASVDNTNKALSTTFTATYTLTQIPEATP